MPEPLKNVTRADGFAVAALGRVVIAVFDRAPFVAQARLMAKVLGAALRAHQAVNIFSVVGAECKVPDEAVRDQLVRDVRAVQAQIGVVATVIEGGGFSAAALRGAATGMTLMLRPSYPTRVFASMQDGAEFVVKGAAVRPSEVAIAVARLRHVA
jgi:hypothetical protein